MEGVLCVQLKFEPQINRTEEPAEKLFCTNHIHRVTRYMRSKMHLLQVDCKAKLRRLKHFEVQIPQIQTK